MSDKNDDIKTYMLGCGIKEALMTKGFLAHVHEVNRGQVDLRLPNGEHRILLLDLSHVPTTVASSKLQRWQKLLNRCQRTSATIRFLNARWLSGNQWVADESTILLEQAMYIHGSDIKLWEWFSGAFGGWSRAAAFLQDQGFPISVVGASDIDPHSTQIWNMNRKLINKKEVVDAQIMDVRDIEHWEKVMEAETNCVTLSSSCKSFSLAGLKKGWQSEDGQTLACALLLAAKHGFRCILLENVANLKHDPKLYQILTAVLDFCGLEIAYEGVISMTGIHPVERTRLIMVVKQKHDEEVQESESNFMSHYEQKAGISLWETKRWMTLSEELMYDLILDDQTIEKYAKQSSMTYAMRQKVQVWNRVSALFARAITSNMAMPAGTMMAGYNHQHVIAETTGSNQILGSLRHVKDLTFRFVHPIEVVLAMGSVFGIVLPRNIRLSMNGVGNCISEMHALIGLATGFKLWKRLFPKVGQFQVRDLLKLHFDCCLGVDSVHVETTDEQVCMIPISKIPLSDVQNSRESHCLQTQRVDGNASEPTNGNHASEVRSCHETLNPPQTVPDIRASESIRKHPKASVHPVPNCIRPTAESHGFGNASEPTNGNHASEVRSCHETLNPPQPVPDIRASESIRKHPKASESIRKHPCIRCQIASAQPQSPRVLDVQMGIMGK